MMTYGDGLADVNILRIYWPISRSHGKIRYGNSLSNLLEDLGPCTLSGK